MATDQNDRLLLQVVGLLTEIRDLLQPPAVSVSYTTPPDGQGQEPAASASDASSPAPKPASQEQPTPEEPKPAPAKRTSKKQGRKPRTKSD